MKYYCNNGDLIEIGKEYCHIDGDKLYCARITNEEYPILCIFDNDERVLFFTPASIVSLWENRPSKIVINGQSTEVTKEQYTKIMEIINNV